MENNQTLKNLARAAEIQAQQEAKKKRESITPDQAKARAAVNLSKGEQDGPVNKHDDRRS